jgi:hypothetical protein
MELNRNSVDQTELNKSRLNSIVEYEEFRKQDNEALCIGLFREDLERAFSDERTLFYEGITEKGEKIYNPVLVHTETLEWWNNDLLDELYSSRDVYVYTHPKRSSDSDDEKITKVLEAAARDGFVIATEKYKSDETSPIAKFIKKYNDEKPGSVTTFGDSELPSSVDFFVTEVNFHGAETKASPSIFTVYEQMIEDGLVIPNDENGVSIAREITGEEANKIWQLYKSPFDNLGKNDPTKAGYSEEMLMELLSDPNVLKVVNRSEGEIITLLLLLDNLSDAPWFNENYYKTTYPEFYETGNIVLSPCVVTDEEKQGNDYAIDTLDFMARIYARRGSNTILSFECTQISTQYVPAISRYVLEKTGLLSLSSLDEPIGTIEYFGIDDSVISD